MTTPERSAKACVNCFVLIILSSFVLLQMKHLCGMLNVHSLQRDEGFQEQVCTEPPCLSAAPEFYRKTPKKEQSFFKVWPKPNMSSATLD